MRVLVTGATGKVGHAIAFALLERGDQVRAARPRSRGGRRASCRRESSRFKAMSPMPRASPPRSRAASSSSTRWGCPSSGSATRRSSIGSTRSAAARSPRAARRAGVRRFIHTSTHDVFHADSGAALRRDDARRLPEGDRVRALQAARRGAGARRARRDGGRDPQSRRASTARRPHRRRRSRTASSSRWSASGSRRVPPGGTGYAFVEGVAAGHLLAAEKGARRRALHPGRRLRRASGRSRRRCARSPAAAACRR